TATSWPIRILTYIENISMRFADHVLTINQPIEDLLISRGLTRSKSTIIMNSVDEKTLTGVPKVGSPDEKRFVMMYHGTLTLIYGLDIAIKAFSLVSKDMPGAELWVLGSGPETSTLSKLVQKLGLGSTVKLVGQVPRSEIPVWLSQCNVGILPIRRDIFLD